MWHFEKGRIHGGVEKKNKILPMNIIDSIGRASRNDREGRPDPDVLLQKIEKEQRGQLTLFLGAAAGVGKTDAMLEAARDRQTEGIDVVIGWVETHGREETDTHPVRNH